MPSRPARSRRDPFDDVLRIAVLRGGGLGDLLFALPAIDALAAAYPEAEIVLLGTRMHEELLQGRPGSVSRVEVLPRARGVNSPDDADDRAEIADFLTRMRARRFDLACQLHGGGRHSNPFLAELRARHTIGTATDDALALERTMPYEYYQHEVLRWLETVALAGADPVSLDPRIIVTDGERTAAAAHLAHGTAGRAVIHPGASDPRRRWPAERFAEVAGRLAGEGIQVLVVGEGADAHVADGIADLASSSLVTSLGGRLSLGELAGLLAQADVFVGNDSGPRHLAQAVGCPTASVFWAGNLINGGPLTRTHHRVQLAWTTRCPVCGTDATQVGWTAPRCEHDVSFVADVSVDAVWSDVSSLLDARPVHAVAATAFLGA